NRHVGLAARMRLNVSMFGRKELLGALDGELFGNIDIFTAAVPAAFWVAFGIFISQDRALRFHDGQAGEVFTGDELNVVLLALALVLDYVSNLGINEPEPQFGWNNSRFHLPDAPFVASSLKTRAEKGIDNLPGVRWCGVFARETEHIGVVVTPSQRRGDLVTDRLRPEAQKLHGGDDHTPSCGVIIDAHFN